MVISSIADRAILPASRDNQPAASTISNASATTGNAYDPAVKVSLSNEAQEKIEQSGANESGPYKHAGERLETLFNRLDNLLVSASGRTLNGRPADRPSAPENNAEGIQANVFTGQTDTFIQEFRGIFDEIKEIFADFSNPKLSPEEEKQVAELNALLDEVDDLVEAIRSNSLKAGDENQFRNIFNRIENVFSP